MKRLLAAAALVAAFIQTPTAHAGLSPRTVTRATKVFMVSDSVGLGARWALQREFTGNWQIYETGKAGIMTDQLMRWYVDPELKPNSYDNAIVAAGYNYPYWDPPRFQRMVDQMVNLMVARGVKHIFWVTIREVTPANYSGWGRLAPQYKNLFLAYPTANAIIKKATARHPQLSIIDWSAISDQRDLTADGIHLNQPGASRYSKLAKDIVAGAPLRQAADTITTMHLAGEHGVPADAPAVSLQVAVTNPRTSGGLTVWPCSESRPTYPDISWGVGEAVSAAVVAPIDPDGNTCVWQSTEARVTVSLRGAITSVSGYQWLPNARTVTNVTTTPATMPAPATAPSGAHTALVALSGSAGKLPVAYRVYECGTIAPATATFTSFATGTSNVLAMVRTDDQGQLCATASGSGRISVTQVATFPLGSTAAAVLPTRVLDTRSRPAAAGTVQVSVAGVRQLPAAGTLLGAITSVTAWKPANPGSSIVRACSPGTSPVRVSFLEPNHPRTGTTLSGIDPTSGGLCVSLSAASTLTVDVLGTFGDAFLVLDDTTLLTN